MIDRSFVNRQSLLLLLLLAIPMGVSWALTPQESAQRLMESILTAARIVQILAIAAGLFLLFTGLFEMKRYGEMRTMMSQQMSVARPLVMIVSGAGLLIFPDLIGTFMLAFWGQATPAAYPAGSSAGPWAPMVKAITRFIQLLGIIAMFRAVMLFAKAGNHGQQSQHGKAMVHLFGGVLCLNIVGLHQLFMYVFGD